MADWIGVDMGRVAMPIADRIKSRIVVDDNGCWAWQGAHVRGYGVMSIGSRSDGTRRMARVHRISYEEFVGPIPEGLEIDHLCRVTLCCNPDHLEPVTNLENRRRIPPKTHCPQGHPMVGENVFLNPSGARCCRECRRAWTRITNARRASRKAG